MFKKNFQPHFCGKAEPAGQDLPWDKRKRSNDAALIHFLLVAYIKFLTKVEISLTEITSRIREQLMSNSHLLDLLSLDRKTLAKPPNWDTPRQLELFEEFLM